MLPRATFFKANTNPRSLLDSYLRQTLTSSNAYIPGQNPFHSCNAMTNPKIPSLTSVSKNNQKVDRALDALVELAEQANPENRSDRDELEKTAQLMLLLGLMAGDSGSQAD